MEELNKKKYDFFLYLLEEGDAMVCLDSRHPDVDVPESHKDNSSLNLVFNLNFKRPFEITEQGIFALLAFNGRPHQCALPFSAVWSMYDPKMKNGQVWEESIPTDMNLSDQAIVIKPEKFASNLKSVKTSGKPPAENKTEGKRDRSHLRVIK
ncbi:ClpXP protease specificity-enhancing factor SspB [Nitrospinae bacterium]|nr:ClpXP protease specificity-enhancing factor SspB [Nitrospinota bacterium]